MYLQFLIVLVMTIIFLLLGYKLSYVVKKRKLKIILGVIFFVLCLPGLAFLIMDLPIFKKPIWLIEFRCISRIELLSAFWGLFIGFITVKADTEKVRWRMFNKYFYIIAMLLIIPANMQFIGITINTENLKSEWSEEVCLQSEDFTCGPSAIATVFRYFGQEKTEGEVAKGVYTNRTGTSVYEIIRYIRKNGMKVECFYEKDLSKIAVPSILDVNVNSIGHVIVYLGNDKEKYIIGDPLEGRVVLTKDEFQERYDFDGFVMSVKNANVIN